MFSKLAARHVKILYTDNHTTCITTCLTRNSFFNRHYYLFPYIMYAMQYLNTNIKQTSRNYCTNFLERYSLVSKIGIIFDFVFVHFGTDISTVTRRPYKMQPYYFDLMKHNLVTHLQIYFFNRYCWFAQTMVRRNNSKLSYGHLGFGHQLELMADLQNIF